MIEGFEELDFKNHDEMLEGLIPFLNRFASKKGKEGNAYFVGDDYIVKSIVNSYRQEKMATFFDCYIKEQQKFANQGLLIPKLYSYKIVNSLNEDGSSCVAFYILEEKFKGSDMFIRASDNFFGNFKRVFGVDYSEGIVNDEKSLMNESMKNYINGFINQNNFLMGLSDDKFDDLVTTVYKMFKHGKYSIPDVHAGNLLVNKDGFNVIDNYMLDRTSNGLFKTMSSERFLTTRFLNVFRENIKITSLLRDPAILKDQDWSKLYQLQEENMFYTGEVMKKLMISVKRCISQNEEFEINSFIPALKGHLHRFLDIKLIDDIAKDIEKGE